jgi:D-xylose transport system ATP-binding protein
MSAVSLDTSPATTSAPCLAAVGLTKHYGHVTALDDVSAHLSDGEVVAIVGDNGAGKSTFVSILCGRTVPDQGAIYLDGRRVTLDTPQQAYNLGIATVFQDLALVEQRDVASNLFLGREPRRLKVFVNRRAMYAEAERAIERMRVKLPSVRVEVADLSGGQRQAVAISRAVMRGSRIILMDEPTAALGVRESRRVIELITELRDSGHAVAVVSHNIESVFEFADRIMVFRLGKKVADLRASDVSRADIVSLIVGGDLGGTGR